MSKLAAGVVGLVLLAIMVVTLVDVIGRYLFNAPVLGADDLIRFGMAILVFAALPEVCRRREHIAVDLLSHGRAAGIVRRAEPLFGVVSAALLLFIAWRLAVVGLDASDYGDRSPLLRIPYAPLAYFLAAMAALSAVIELVIGARRLIGQEAR